MRSRSWLASGVRRGSPAAWHAPTLVTIGLVAVVLGACSVPPPRVPVATVRTGAVDCTSPAARVRLAPAADPSASSAPDGPPAGRVPVDFDPVAVVECTVPPGNPAADVLERHPSGDLTDLVEALRERSASKPLNGSCVDMYEFKPGLFLVDASGRYVHAAWPLDACDFIQKPAKDAVTALHVDSEQVIALAGG